MKLTYAPRDTAYSLWLLWAVENKNVVTYLCDGWFRGILVMASYNHHLTGQYNSLYNQYSTGPPSTAKHRCLYGREAALGYNHHHHHHHHHHHYHHKYHHHRHHHHPQPRSKKISWISNPPSTNQPSNHVIPVYHHLHHLPPSRWSCTSPPPGLLHFKACLHDHPKPCIRSFPTPQDGQKRW